MYTTRNFKTKKEFKAAVQAWNDSQKINVAATITGQGAPAPVARAVTYYQPGPFGGTEPRDGWMSFEGPHYPQPHRWYARARAEAGVIVEVK